MRALAIRPQDPSARWLLARCQRLRGERDEARATLERLHREQPHMDDVSFDLAQLYRDLGMSKEAAPLLDAYRRSLQQRQEMRKAALEVMTQPDSARVHLRMGRLCLERGLVGRAILSLERAKAWTPAWRTWMHCSRKPGPRCGRRHPSAS
jgi:thioredoxin-like negative regulator of GroEL